MVNSCQRCNYGVRWFSGLSLWTGGWISTSNRITSGLFKEGCVGKLSLVNTRANASVLTNDKRNFRDWFGKLDIIYETQCGIHWILAFIISLGNVIQYNIHQSLGLSYSAFKKRITRYDLINEIVTHCHHIYFSIVYNWTIRWFYVYLSYANISSDLLLNS